MEPTLPLTVALRSSPAPPRSVSLPLHPPTESRNHRYSFSCLLGFTSTSHSVFHSCLPNVSILSLICLLSTLFMTHAFSSFSQHVLCSVPLSFSIPGTALCSHPLIPTFLALQSPPRLSSYISLAFPGCVSSHRFIPPSSKHTSFQFIFFFTDEWWEIWKCQHDQAGDQRGRC